MHKINKGIILAFTLTSLSASVQAATTSAVSTDAYGVIGTDVSNSPRANYDGSYIVYETTAQNIVGSLNDQQQIMRTRLGDRKTQVVSQATSGTLGNGYSYQADISNDGNRVVFTSYATNLVNRNVGTSTNIFVKDIKNNEIFHISKTYDGALPTSYSDQPAISGDGKWVTFVSAASNITADSVLDGPNVYLHNIASGGTYLVSKGIDGRANGESITPAISHDGRYVVFASNANNLTDVLDNNEQYDIYLYDHQNGTTELVSANDFGAIADKKSSAPSISADGRFVAFHSVATNLDVGIASKSFHVFLRDRKLNTTRLVTQINGDLANSISLNARINDSGRFISFITRSSNLVSDANSGYDLVAYDRISGAFEILTRNNAGIQIDSTVSFISDISGNGQVGVFASGAPNLGADNIINVFARVRDPIPNIPPVAIAGADQTVLCNGVNTAVNFDGGQSYDLDGFISSYTWDDGISTHTGVSGTTMLPVGQHQFTLSITDDSNATSSDSLNISVIDDMSPLIVAEDIELDVENVNGAAHSFAFSASDNCSEPSVSASPLLDMYPLGDTVITITATDAAGKTSTETRTVTVVDRVSPKFGVIGELNFEATGPLTPVDLPQPEVDELFLASLVSDAQESYRLGSYELTWTATDTSHNQSTATQLIHVRDTTPPTLVLGNTVSLEATSTAGASYSIYPEKAADSCQCGQLELSFEPALSVYPLGTTLVTATLTDQSGNIATDTIEIKVADKTAPVFTSLPADVTAEATGKLTAVALGSAMADDIFAVTLSNNAPASFPLGMTEVTWTAKDANGNATSHLQKVTIVDTTPPALNAGDDIVLEATSIDGASTTLNPEFSDTCDCGDLTLNFEPTLATYPLGETIVTVSVTDQSGNTVKDSLKITVIDTTAPVLTLPDNKLVEATGILTHVEIGNARANDLFEYTITHNAPALFPVGDTAVTWTVVDKHGNTASGMQIISVVDTTAPEFTVSMLKDELWPPRHRLVHALDVIHVNDLVDQNPVVEITVTTEDEHKRRHRHRMQQEDWKIVESSGTWEVWLRAEKLLRSREDRLYSIEISASDMYGNTQVKVAEVTVPHSKRKHAHNKKDTKQSHKKVKSEKISKAQEFKKTRL